MILVLCPLLFNADELQGPLRRKAGASVHPLLWHAGQTDAVDARVLAAYDRERHESLTGAEAPDPAA